MSALTFYYGSGSPFGWRVWLALEHKQVPYELKLISFDAGDLKKPEFAEINPRRRIPAIVDDGFRLYESAAIVEYLDERFPERPIFPRELRPRAIARRLIREIDAYLAGPHDELIEQVFYTKPDEQDAAKIQAARRRYLDELAFFEGQLRAPFLVGDQPGAADYTLLPFLAALHRFDMKRSDIALTAAFGPNTRAWLDRMKALPYYEKTTPPHWRST